MTANLLRVDAAFSRPGPGGTFDHSIQVTNISNRRVTFRVGFRMSNVQNNQASLGQAFTLAPAGSRIIVLGNGTATSTASRIGGGVSLTC